MYKEEIGFVGELNRFATLGDLVPPICRIGHLLAFVEFFGPTPTKSL